MTGSSSLLEIRRNLCGVYAINANGVAVGWQMTAGGGTEAIVFGGGYNGDRTRRVGTHFRQ
jgi:hypothetical protein